MIIRQGKHQNTLKGRKQFLNTTIPDLLIHAYAEFRNYILWHSSVVKKKRMVYDSVINFQPILEVYIQTHLITHT